MIQKMDYSYLVMLNENEIVKFSTLRGITLMFKNNLDVISELKAEHDKNVENLKRSLSDIEEFIKNRYNINISLLHLANHIDYLDSEKMQRIRKNILDYGNSIKREIENL